VDGDLLVRFADKPVEGVDELHRILRTWPAGTQARLGVIRRGARLDLDITPAWAA
jgi:type II secretory pathway component PulC